MTKILEHLKLITSPDFFAATVKSHLSKICDYNHFHVVRHLLNHFFFLEEVTRKKLGRHEKKNLFSPPTSQFSNPDFCILQLIKIPVYTIPVFTIPYIMEWMAA